MSLICHRNERSKHVNVSGGPVFSTLVPGPPDVGGTGGTVEEKPHLHSDGCFGDPRLVSDSCHGHPPKN